MLQRVNNDHQTQKDPSKIQESFRFWYQNSICECIYAMITCQPDISTSCQMLSIQCLPQSSVHCNGQANHKIFLKTTNQLDLLLACTTLNSSLQIPTPTLRYNMRWYHLKNSMKSAHKSLDLHSTSIPTGQIRGNGWILQEALYLTKLSWVINWIVFHWNHFHGGIWQRYQKNNTIYIQHHVGHWYPITCCMLPQFYLETMMNVPLWQTPQNQPHVQGMWRSNISPSTSNTLSSQHGLSITSSYWRKYTLH